MSQFFPNSRGKIGLGPQKCIIGLDPSGSPIYSGGKILKGNCSGALEVYYATAQDFYRGFMENDRRPVTVATEKDDPLLVAVHESLMAYHKRALLQVGVDVNSVPMPETVVISNWINDGDFTPGIGKFLGTDLGREIIRAPLKDRLPLYIANQDYGYRSGWAVGGLKMAEKILQAELQIPKPAWLDADWYKTNVLDLP